MPLRRSLPWSPTICTGTPCARSPVPAPPPPAPRTARHHLHGQHRHVAMTGRIPGLGQPRGGNAEHHETLQRAQGHRVIHDEDPIVAPRRRTPQHAQAQPTAPIQDGGRGRNAQRQDTRQQAQHPTDPATTDAAMQIQRMLNCITSRQ
jgi:hypothetical protein